MDKQENKTSETTIELTIDLERDDIEQDLQNTAQEISKELRIPGFRAGHAPYDVVSRHVGGEAKLYEHALEKIVNRTARKVLDEKKYNSIGQPVIAIQKMVPPFGISYKITLSLMPEIELGEAGKIKIKKEEPKVEEKDIQQVINNLQDMRTQESAVTREAKIGDKAVLDFEVKREGVTIENGSSKDYPLVIGDNKFIPGFEEQIIGLKTGDKKSFELEFPKQYHEKSLAGKIAMFDVVIKQVFERTTPEFNDAFAKILGSAQTAEELKKQITENLKHERTREAEEKFHMQVMEELVKLSKVGEIPEQAIKEEADKMLHELEHSISQQGMKIEDYLKSIKKTQDELQTEFKPKAEHRLKLGLVARKFGKQENISISDQEVLTELETAKKAYANQPELLGRLEQDEYKNYVRNMLMSKKTFEKLAEKVSK
jgi:trigger factor